MIRRGTEDYMSGFRKFLMRGNLIDLAVAVVIGLAFAAIVTALVADLITPLIAAIGGKPNFSNLTFTVNHSKFKYGDFINALVSFVIIAAVVYFVVVLPINRVTALTTRNEAATTKDCPECLSTIPLGARRCMYCTAVLAEQGAPPAADVPQQRQGRHGQFAPGAE
jgi:large conductance mechanosensitive channel